MLPALQRYIRIHELFHPGDRVGVAVSGGADSVGLLRALLDLRRELGIVLSVVHVHHGIRGSEADDDEQFVSNLAMQFELPLQRERVDVPAHSRTVKLSLESAARELRYRFFKHLLTDGQCDKIATAHTLDDQAETVLLRILRGTGTRGLAAIPPLRNVSTDLAAHIVRPLLNTGRAAIESYLREIGQPWREDSTNRDPQHLRNRIRQHLLPQLEREYNPALRQSLVNLAEIARAEELHWAAEIARLGPVLTDLAHDHVTLDRPKLLALPLALQRRLLVDLANRLDLPVGFDDIELMRQIASAAGSSHEFDAGWCVSSSRMHLEIRRSHALGSDAEYDLALPVPGELCLPGAIRLKSSLLQAGDCSRYNSATLLAYERLELPLRVRNWRPGDRYWPAGSKQSEKLKRLFQQRHVPAEARGSWPVALSGLTIVWVRGFPVASEWQARNTKAVLIEECPADPGETRND